MTVERSPTTESEFFSFPVLVKCHIVLGNYRYIFYACVRAHACIMAEFMAVLINMMRMPVLCVYVVVKTMSSFFKNACNLGFH